MKTKSYLDPFDPRYIDSAERYRQAYQPKTGERCGCRKGVQRDNCPQCEGTGWRIDFRAIREAVR